MHSSTILNLDDIHLTDARTRRPCTFDALCSDYTPRDRIAFVCDASAHGPLHVGRTVLFHRRILRTPPSAGRSLLRLPAALCADNGHRRPDLPARNGQALLDALRRLAGLAVDRPFIGSSRSVRHPVQPADQSPALARR